MGTPALQFLSTPIPSERSDYFAQLPSFPPDAPARAGVPIAPNTLDSLDTADSEAAIDQAYDAMIYRSQTQQISLALQMQEVAANIVQEGEEETAAASFQAQQLEFSFFAESRTEELMLFRQRTAAVADQLEGAPQSRFSQTSSEVAMRFEFSMSISGEALIGYTDASEALADQDELMEQFMSFTEKLLGAADDFFNEALSLFSGSTLELPTLGFQQLLDAFAGEYLSAFFGENTEASEAGAIASASAVQMEFKFSFSASMSVEQTVVQESDPIIFDLDGDGYELTRYQNGARFDILGNGSTQQTAFVTGGDAFLALDRNGDGEINSGQELFGDQRGAANGFEELRKMDTNQDGRIDKNDAGYEDLLLFKDNGNGKTEAGELISLAEAGIASIDLGYKNVDELTSGANHLGQISAFQRTDGSTGKVADAILNYIA